MRKLTIWQAVAISTQFGFVLAASVLVGLGLGLLVDRWTHVGAIAYLVGALLGMVSGVFSIVKLINVFLRKEPPATDAPRRQPNNRG
jgi:F0F1-type ATP synthase assembly protein I